MPAMGERILGIARASALHLFFAVGLFGSTGCGLRFTAVDLTFINGAEPETIDPALVTGQPEGRIVNTLFEGLTAFNEFGQAVPGVAERWEISEDGREYLFFLRPNARWSDGSGVTAQDFVRSWKRTLDPATGSEYSYMLHPIAGARAFNQGEVESFDSVGVTALDDHTLKVRLDHPTPYFLDLCAFVTFAPVHLPTLETYGDDWIKPQYLVNNGAYVIEFWRLNDRIRLKKNPFYWDRENVRLESIDVLPISSATVAFNHYHSGGADLLMDKGLTPVPLLDWLRERADFHSSPILATYFLRFNVTRGPLADPRVRKAFALAIDRSVLTEKITRAGEEVATGFVPPGTNNHQPIAGLPYDPVKARELLAEAGYPEGRGFPLVSYLYNSSELNDAIAVELQSMIKETLGIDLIMRKQEWKVYLNSLSRLDYDIARSSWVGDYNDPNTFLDLFVTGGGNNRTGWGYPRYDGLIAQAASETNIETRAQFFANAERILVEEMVPIAPLFYFVGIQMYDRQRVGGLEPNLLDEHPLRRMFLKEKDHR